MNRRKFIEKRPVMQSLIAFVVAAVMIFGGLPSAFASDDITIVIDGVGLVTVDQNGNVISPIIKDGTTYLPVRAISSAVGQDIAWEGETNTVYIGKRNVTAPYSSQVKICVNGSLFNPKDINGNSLQPFIQDGVTYLPVRAVGEAFGLNVEWDGENRRVLLTTPSYRFILSGDWSGFSDSYIKAAENRLNIFPRLIARWGSLGDEPRTIVINMTENYRRNERVVNTYTAPDGKAVDVIAFETAGTSEHFITFSSTDLQEYPDDFTTYVHELAHVAQSYRDFDSEWWTENLAEYASFRYFVPTVSGQMATEEYSKDDPEVRDWGWEPYGKCDWFFAYMDYRYPTVKAADGSVSLGLIDSINDAIKRGKVNSDGGSSHSDPAFNAIVRSITGFDNMEALRQQYVRELNTGAWSFKGFDGYEDNFLTDNVSAKVEFVWISENLMNGATVYGSNGGSRDGSNPAMMADGNLETGWIIDRVPDEDHPYVIFDLGKEKTFNSYSLLPGKGIAPVDELKADGAGRAFGAGAGAWKFTASNDLMTWYVLDQADDQRGVAVSRDLPEFTARYIRLEYTAPASYYSAPYRSLNPYPEIDEMMLFYRP